MGNPDTLSPEVKVIVERVDKAVSDRIRYWTSMEDKWHPIMIGMMRENLEILIGAKGVRIEAQSNQSGYGYELIYESQRRAGIHITPDEDCVTIWFNNKTLTPAKQTYVQVSSFSNPRRLPVPAPGLGPQGLSYRTALEVSGISNRVNLYMDYDEAIEEPLFQMFESDFGHLNRHTYVLSATIYSNHVTIKSK